MGALGRFYRKLEDALGTVNHERHKRNRARTGLPKRNNRKAPDGLIYGMQGVFFENSPAPKPWQVMPNHYRSEEVLRPLNMEGYKGLKSGAIISLARQHKKAEMRQLGITGKQLRKLRKAERRTALI